MIYATGPSVKSKNREIFERFLEKKIELIPMFPLF